MTENGDSFQGIQRVSCGIVLIAMVLLILGTLISMAAQSNPNSILFMIGACMFFGGILGIIVYGINFIQVFIWTSRAEARHAKKWEKIYQEIQEQERRY